MRDLLILAIHLLVTLVKLLRPGGARRVAAESLLLKHQLLISNRSRRRAPNLTMIDRLVLGLTSIFVSPHRISKLSVSIRPATLTQVPQGVGPSKISPTVLLVTPEAKAWPERVVRATHRGHRRDETPQSQVRLCPHRPPDRSCLWYRDRQGCRASRTCHTRSTQAS